MILLGLTVQNVCAEVNIGSISLDPTHIEAGDEVSIYVKFHESVVSRDVWAGKEEAGAGKGVVKDDVTVFYTTELAPASEISREYITLVDAEKNVGHLFPGESWTTPFKIKVEGNAPEADYSMEFRVYKTDVQGKKKEITRSLKFNVPVKGVVKLRIDSKNELTVGLTNKMKISVENMGGGKAKHTTVSVNASKPLTVLDASEQYVGGVEGGRRKDLTFNVYVESNAKLGPYEIPVKIEYLNDSGSKVIVSQIIGVKVDGEPGISVGLDSQEDFKRGASGKVVLNVVNNGFIDVKFLKLKLLPTEYYDVMSVNGAYIGNLESDDYETEEYSIKLADTVEAGKLPLSVEVGYKTENNEVTHTEQYTVNLNVLSEREYNLKHPEAGTKSQITNIIIAIPAAIVGYLVLWFIYKLIGAITGFINSKLFARRTRP